MKTLSIILALLLAVMPSAFAQKIESQIPTGSEITKGVTLVSFQPEQQTVTIQTSGGKVTLTKGVSAMVWAKDSQVQITLEGEVAGDPGTYRFTTRTGHDIKK